MDGPRAVREPRQGRVVPGCCMQVSHQLIYLLHDLLMIIAKVYDSASVRSDAMHI